MKKILDKNLELYNAVFTLFDADMISENEYARICCTLLRDIMGRYAIQKVKAETEVSE